MSVGLNSKWSSQVNLRKEKALPEADLRAGHFSTFLFVCLCYKKKTKTKKLAEKCWVELGQVFIIIIIILILNIGGLKQSGHDITGLELGWNGLKKKPK